MQASRPHAVGRITYNAPVVLTFSLAAVGVFIVTSTAGPSAQAWFVASPSLVDARSYVGLISHILGHASWEHLLGNFMLILLVGPILIVMGTHGRRGVSRLLMGSVAEEVMRRSMCPVVMVHLPVADR